MNKRITYEQEKMEITREVSKIMDLAITPIFRELDLISAEFIKKLYLGRRNRALIGGRLRDIIIKVVLNLCGIINLSKDHLKVIASGEIYNMASYYQNWHLDDKKEIKNDMDKKLCHIVSHLFREIAEGLILETRFNDSIKLRLIKEISESNKAIQLGQSFELNFLNISNSQLINDVNILENYKKRAYLMSGKFYGSSFAMGSIMVGMRDEITSYFRQIGEWFGTGGQIINDVGDFCLNKNVAKNPEKDYQDQFADLEKGTITLAIHELSKIIELKDYSGRKLTLEEKEELLKIMVSYRCFDSSRKITNNFRNKMIKSLRYLPPNPLNNKLPFIISTFFNSNKFYVNLREEHNYNWNINKALER